MVFKGMNNEELKEMGHRLLDEYKLLSRKNSERAYKKAFAVKTLLRILFGIQVSPTRF